MGIPTTKIYSFQLISPTAANAKAARYATRPTFRPRLFSSSDRWAVAV